MYVFINNRLTPAADARVSVFDRGFAYGDSLFETIKVMRGKPVFLREHCRRLAAGLDEAGISYAPDVTGLRRQALELAQRNSVEEGRLRVQVTRGDPKGPSAPDPPEGLEPTVLVTLEPFPGFPEEVYEKGVAVRTVALNRGGYAQLKSAGLISMILARRQAAQAGCHEAILTTGHGRLLEGAFSNIFFLAGNMLVTAPVTDAILAGVTRQKIIDIAPGAGLSLQEHSPKMEELGFGETAAFLTSAILGICPVSEIDGVRLNAAPEVFQRLRDGLGALEEKDIESGQG